MEILFKKKSIATTIEVKNTFQICDIWRLRIPKTKDSLFGKVIGLALFNLGWTFFVQEPIYKTNALASSCSDQSPILFLLHMIIWLKKTKGERVYINLIKLYIKRKISSSHEKSHSNHRSFSKQRKYIQIK